jgi:hypothetical protein
VSEDHCLVITTTEFGVKETKSRKFSQILKVFVDVFVTQLGVVVPANEDDEPCDVYFPET